MHRRCITHACAAGVFLALLAASPPAPAAPAASWPQWRGPSRDGVCAEKGLLKQWPADGPKLLWETRGIGRGYSSVSIVGGRIFTMGDLADGSGMSQFIIAIDAATRRKLWQAKVGPPHGDGGPRCTPTVDRGLVFAVGTDGDLVCVDAATGRERWRKNFQRDFGGRMMSGWRYSESPLVDGDMLVCTPGADDAYVVALDRTTGNVVWKCPAPTEGGRNGAGYSSIVVSRVGAQTVYVQNTGRGLIGVSAKDGKLLWHYGRIACTVANITTPVIQGAVVFGSNAYNAGSAAVRQTADAGGVEVKEMYYLDARTFQNHHGGVVLVGQHLYGGHGQNAGAPTCIELATGKIAWKGSAPAGGSAAVLYADGMLYYRYDSGTMALLEATPTAMRVVGTFREPAMPGPAWAHPVILEGKLYLRHDDALFCYDVKKR